MLALLLVIFSSISTVGTCSEYLRIVFCAIYMKAQVSVVVLATAGAVLEDVSFVVSLCGETRLRSVSF